MASQRKRDYHELGWLPGLVALTMAVLACAGRTPIVAPDVKIEPFPEVEARPYQLQAGDVIAVKFWGNSELDEEVVIRPDGLISLPFVDEVMAAGRTPGQLDAELTARYAGELESPEVTVIVRELSGHRVYIGGEVESPGAVELAGTMTLLQAIQEAGYFLESARRKQVLVVRTQNGERFARLIDMRPILSGQDPDSDLVLQASDTVIVPRTKVTNLDSFLRQYFYDLLPIRQIAVIESINN